jgi:hypothetical protein
LPRGDAICKYVVASDEALVIPDIERDPRFADNEAITHWGVRFYAGYPLRSKDGAVFGAFCILDDEPRGFEDKDVELLGTGSGGRGRDHRGFSTNSQQARRCSVGERYRWAASA